MPSIASSTSLSGRIMLGLGVRGFAIESRGREGLSDGDGEQGRGSGKRNVQSKIKAPHVVLFILFYFSFFSFNLLLLFSIKINKWQYLIHK